MQLITLVNVCLSLSIHLSFILSFSLNFSSFFLSLPPLLLCYFLSQCSTSHNTLFSVCFYSVFLICLFRPNSWDWFQSIVLFKTKVPIDLITCLFFKLTRQRASTLTDPKSDNFYFLLVFFQRKKIQSGWLYVANCKLTFFTIEMYSCRFYYKHSLL